MPEFSIASMDRIIRKSGSNRVSKSAALELSAVIESLGGKIAREAIRKAEQEGVKTITQKHIRKAVKEMEKEI